MTGTRNGCVARLQLPVEGWQTILTVPAGNTLLLKHLAVWNDTPDVIAFGAYVQDPVTMTHTNLLPNDVPATGGLDWEGWIALNPGDQLLIYSAAAGLNLWASGALLPGQADLPLPAGELGSTPPPLLRVIPAIPGRPKRRVLDDG